MANSRAKGSTYERDLCRAFCVWWTGDKKLAKVPAAELPMRRTPLSGGWNKTAAAADLLVVDASKLPHPWPFSIEAKNREEWDWAGLFKTNAGWPVRKYWDQTVAAATASHLAPLLVFTKNREEDYIALEPRHAAVLGFKVQIKHSELPFVVCYLKELLTMAPKMVYERVTDKTGTSDTDAAMASAARASRLTTIVLNLPNPDKYAEFDDPYVEDDEILPPVRKGK